MSGRANSIDLAKACFDDRPDLLDRVRLECADVTRMALPTADRVVAADIVEHLSPQELDRLYEHLAGCLKIDGCLLIHSAPSRWFYQYGYTARRRAAKALGVYLSPQPRSRYEQLMHINEQTPRTLRRQLERFFPHVLVWMVCSGRGVFDSIQRRYTIADCKQAQDLFALACLQPIDIQALMDMLQPAPLPDVQASRIDIQAQNPGTVTTGPCEELEVQVCLRNGSERSLTKGYVISSPVSSPGRLNLTTRLLRLRVRVPVLSVICSRTTSSSPNGRLWRLTFGVRRKV